jgi:hypothetical protein
MDIIIPASPHVKAPGGGAACWGERSIRHGNTLKSFEISLLHVKITS